MNSTVIIRIYYSTLHEHKRFRDRDETAHITKPLCVKGFSWGAFVGADSGSALGV